MSSSSARGLAQELTAWHLLQADPYQPHVANVRKVLRTPVTALTISILQAKEDEEEENGGDRAEKKQTAVVQEEKKSGADWRDFLVSKNPTSETLSDLGSVPPEAYEALSRRAKARLEAFLEGVSLAVAAEDLNSVSSPNSSPEKESPPKPERFNSTELSDQHSFSLIEGLAGFRVFEKGSRPTRLASPVLSSLNASRQTLLRSISSQSSALTKRPQIAEEALVTRLELYIRSLHRVKAQGLDCVVAAEPIRAVKARARLLVTAFVDTVGTVRQQSPVLFKLLSTMTQELLAVEALSENLVRVIRRLVADYEQTTSFGSLAFLSTPENAADQRLTPMVLKYLRYLQSNWKNYEAECELERMLSLSLNAEMRHTLKTIEFRSIGHLLEVCQGFRNELQHIELAPGIRGAEETDITDNDAIRQAIRDLQREVITVNGQVLPPVTSRKDLIHLLSQTLNSRTLTTAPVKVKVRRKSSRRKKSVRRSESEPVLYNSSDGISDSLSSGNETDLSASSPGVAQNGGRRSHRRSFRLSTIDFLTKRLLLAASRTGTGGDAYFVVHDLFGGDEVEVVPSQSLPTHGRTIRPGTIEIIVRLASVTIKCHGSFDVYPKSLMGDCEPLIQLHTSTAETISLREVRATDSSSEDGVTQDLYSSDDGESAPVMVLEERKTDRTGWRTLSIRPALYEKVEVWSTPS